MNKPALTKEQAAKRLAWGQAQRERAAEAKKRQQRESGEPRTSGESLSYKGRRRLGEYGDPMPINGQRLPVAEEKPTPNEE